MLECLEGCHLWSFCSVLSIPPPLLLGHGESQGRVTVTVVVTLLLKVCL